MRIKLLIAELELCQMDLVFKLLELQSELDFVQGLQVQLTIAIFPQLCLIAMPLSLEIVLAITP